MVLKTLIWGILKAQKLMKYQIHYKRRDIGKKNWSGLVGNERGKW